MLYLIITTKHTMQLTLPEMSLILIQRQMKPDNNGAWKVRSITSFLNSFWWDYVWISLCLSTSNSRDYSHYIFAVCVHVHVLISLEQIFQMRTNVHLDPKLNWLQFDGKRSKVNISERMSLSHGQLASSFLLAKGSCQGALKLFTTL